MAAKSTAAGATAAKQGSKLATARGTSTAPAPSTKPTKKTTKNRPKKKRAKAPKTVKAKATPKHKAAAAPAFIFADGQLARDEKHGKGQLIYPTHAFLAELQALGKGNKQVLLNHCLCRGLAELKKEAEKTGVLTVEAAGLDAYFPERLAEMDDKS